MTELGETLQRARLERGITLEELEETTKIRKRYLEAIEKQDFDVLPGNFYVRAFIKNYAEAVGLNPDEILKLYKNVIPATTGSADMKLARTPARRANFQLERWSKWASMLLMVSFFLLIVVLIYFYFYQSDPRRDTVLDETPVTDQQQPPPETEADDEPNAGAGSPPDLATEEPDSESDSVSEPEVSLVNSEGSIDLYTITNAEAVTVDLEIIGPECWVWVKQDSQDGEEIFMGTMSNAETASWEYEGSIWIRLGQASSAAVTVNDVELEPFERPNVRDLQLNLAIAEEELPEDESRQAE